MDRWKLCCQLIEGAQSVMLELKQIERCHDEPLSVLLSLGECKNLTNSTGSHQLLSFIFLKSLQDLDFVRSTAASGTRIAYFCGISSVFRVQRKNCRHPVRAVVCREGCPKTRASGSDAKYARSRETALVSPNISTEEHRNL